MELSSGGPVALTVLNFRAMLPELS